MVIGRKIGPMNEGYAPVHFRRLDPEADVECFRLAYGWDRDAPRWYREMDSVFGDYTFDEYVAKAREATQINVGLFEGTEMFAMITTNLVAATTDPVQYGVYDLHLAAARHAGAEKIVGAFASIRRQMFEDLNALALYGWVASVNRPLVSLSRRLGFVPDGLLMFKGMVRGKVIRWERVAYTRGDYEQEKADHRAVEYQPVPEHVRLAAGS